MDRIVRKPELREIFGVSDSTLDNYMNPSSDLYSKNFPKKIYLGGVKRKGAAVGWKYSEVMEYLECCREDNLEREETNID